MPSEYREYNSVPDEAFIDALDVTLTDEDNEIVRVQSGFIAHISSITMTTVFFLRLPHPTIGGRELVLIPEEQQIGVPAGIGTYVTDADLLGWYNNPPPL